MYIKSLQKRRRDRGKLGTGDQSFTLPSLVCVMFLLVGYSKSMFELFTSCCFCFFPLHTTMTIRTTNRVQDTASKTTEMTEFLFAGSQFLEMLAERAQMTTG